MSVYHNCTEPLVIRVGKFVRVFVSVREFVANVLYTRYTYSTVLDAKAVVSNAKTLGQFFYSSSQDLLCAKNVRDKACPITLLESIRAKQVSGVSTSLEYVTRREWIR